MAKERSGKQSAMLLALAFFATHTVLQAQEIPLPKRLLNTEPQPSTWDFGAWMHPLQLDDVKLREQVRAIPQDNKDRVHFFLINGLDPFYSANLNGLAAYCRSIGFTNTACYQMPSRWKVKREIETIRRNDPQARIVLLGYSFGANLARSITNEMQADNTFINCLIYVGGDTIFNTPDSRPRNVGLILNITGHGAALVGRDLFINGDEIDGAANHRLDIHHFGIISQPDTINLIGQELISQASSTRKMPLEPSSSPPAYMGRTP
jgi:hypothetical protein